MAKLPRRPKIVRLHYVVHTTKLEVFDRSRFKNDGAIGWRNFWRGDRKGHTEASVIARIFVGDNDTVWGVYTNQPGRWVNYPDLDTAIAAAKMRT